MTTRNSLRVSAPHRGVTLSIVFAIIGLVIIAVFLSGANSAHQSAQPVAPEHNQQQLEPGQSLEDARLATNRQPMPPDPRPDSDGWNEWEPAVPDDSWQEMSDAQPVMVAMDEGNVASELGSEDEYDVPPGPRSAGSTINNSPGNVIHQPRPNNKTQRTVVKNRLAANKANNNGRVANNVARNRSGTTNRSAGARGGKFSNNLPRSARNLSANDGSAPNGTEAIAEFMGSLALNDHVAARGAGDRRVRDRDIVAENNKKDNRVGAIRGRGKVANAPGRNNNAAAIGANNAAAGRGVNLNRTANRTSAATLTTRYGLTARNTVAAISINNTVAGSRVNINGRVTVTGGNGFIANNVGGIVNVNGAFTQTGGNEAINVYDSSGTITFANANITDPTGTAINIMGGSPRFLFNGNASKTNAGLLVNIDGVGNLAAGAAGDIDFRNGTLVAGGASNGINISNLTTGTTVDFADVNMGVLTPLTNNAVTLNNNNDAIGGNGVISFGALDIVTDGGVGVVANNGGTLSVRTGSVTTLSTASVPAGASSGALALDITGTTAGATNVNFTSITANNSGGGGINLVANKGTWNLGAVNVVNTGGTGVNASNAGTVNIAAGTINTTNGAGFVGNDGTLLNAQFANISTTTSPGSAISLSGLANNSLFAVSGGTIDRPGGFAIDIQNNKLGVADLATFSVSNMVIDFGTTNGLRGINVNAGTGAVTIANNSINLNGTNNAIGIFVQGNDGANTMNLGTGVSFNNTTAGVTGPGSINFNFNNGTNIMGNIQTDGFVFMP